MKNRPFNAFVGTASGIFKGVNALEKTEPLVTNIDGVKSGTNRNPITALSWAKAEDNTKEILVGFASQTVKTYSVPAAKFTRSDDRKCGDGAIVGLSKPDNVLVTAIDSGVVKIWKDNIENSKITCGGPIERMRLHTPRGGQTTIATGGKENDLKLWDLATGKQLFNAKNVRHDELELRVPVWVTDIAFLDDKVAVTTKHGHIRLYDPLSNMRRPVVNVLVPEQSLTSISTCFKDKHVVVGSGSGQMNLVDLRSKGLVMNKYKGFVGCVKSISASIDFPYIASVSTDRHFRVHHLETKELLVKEYMQSKLTSVLVAPDFNFEQPDAVDSDDEVAVTTTTTTITQTLISEPSMPTAVVEVEKLAMDPPAAVTVPSTDPPSSRQQRSSESKEESTRKTPSPAPEKRSRSTGGSNKKKHKT